LIFVKGVVLSMLVAPKQARTVFLKLQRFCCGMTSCIVDSSPSSPQSLDLEPVECDSESGVVATPDDDDVDDVDDEQDELHRSNVGRISSQSPFSKRLWPTPDNFGFRVPYCVEHIPGKGLGVVLRRNVKAGELLWHADHGVAQVYNASELRKYIDSLPDNIARRVLDHMYGFEAVSSELVIEINGDASVVNHSCTPSAGNLACFERLTGRKLDIDPSWPLPGETFSPVNCTVALRDLEIGDEITEDYNT
jgi:hypothetical protein